ncbi:uncharacterized protein CLUP02_02129 [Colletotrichum lupini]|uniref:Uncharacterized protein n=1 Tax=Colletotrichum lupini TaxID=145971 RepID=A0A9Q8SEF5_9PEZI|nr:uncharacterized protein CLUP02_02129 [Colletotrichum lupini]UQC75475.1 hypothetical protein CLUP02_02129 [Colletotrichum lupini]
MLATFVDLDVHGVMDAATSIDTHPFHAPKGKTAIGNEIITALYTAPPHREGAPLSLRKVRGQPEFFTLGWKERVRNGKDAWEDVGESGIKTSENFSSSYTDLMLREALSPKVDKSHRETPGTSLKLWHMAECRDVSRETKVEQIDGGMQRL